MARESIPVVHPGAPCGAQYQTNDNSYYNNDTVTNDNPPLCQIIVYQSSNLPWQLPSGQFINNAIPTESVENILNIQRDHHTRSLFSFYTYLQTSSPE